MAQVSQVLARLRRDPIADLPIAAHVDQVLESGGVTWRERLLPPLVTLLLFLVQVLHGNCAIAALRQLSGLGFAVSSYAEARARRRGVNGAQARGQRRRRGVGAGEGSRRRGARRRGVNA